MCGIAGIIYRQPELYKNLGIDLLQLIQPLETRGPDSCGVGIYSNSVSHNVKILLFATEQVAWEEVKKWLHNQAQVIKFDVIGSGRRIIIDTNNQALDLAEFKHHLATHFPQIHLMSVGQLLEIYKEVGTAENLFQRYQLKDFSGSHGIGHTRMATESVVDTYHSHPFTSAPDLCLVHNGQISNYYKLRFFLEKKGIEFETDNDSEAIAHYIRYQLLQGFSLEQALQNLLNDIDGTYTFLVATSDKIALVRDKFAAKPAVIYETPEMIAIASEYRCFLSLPHYNPNAKISEPDAGEIKIWSTNNTQQSTRFNTNSQLIANS
ncbi:amidophosphoribosyltransferase [Gloeocapsopsis sp. IPPAS B-1203]|uniref:amidophosphoribosyltransferase n=1 Tax=Gloeocapsopsis sp. IPPAS B-1203 TaxID=2049454 RepID=UPI000C179EDC|nr:amidophosphoribosyltransferase [Gloeocapsopsis sp. IPPAS B-1203]PIG93129.1 amidophosphoribosyltransferase [Gloeocapsopsis sp. IPPAS B-1203]